MWFSDKDNKEAGGVNIGFYKQIDYVIGWYTLGIPFPDTLPTETQKPWTLTCNIAEQKVYYCNGRGAFCEIKDVKRNVKEPWHTEHHCYYRQYSGEQ